MNTWLGKLTQCSHFQSEPSSAPQISIIFIDNENSVLSQVTKVLRTGEHAGIMTDGDSSEAGLKNCTPAFKFGNCGIIL